LSVYSLVSKNQLIKLCQELLIQDHLSFRVYGNTYFLFLHLQVKTEMVPESIIEEVIETFANDKNAYEETLSEIISDQPALLAFLDQESNEVLTEEEKDILWYLVLIIITSARRFGTPVQEMSDTSLGNSEESNWEILHNQPKGTFRDKVTSFFEDYKQEDLLAFVEDSLEIEENSPITTVGRDVIFISAKTVIDTIFEIQKTPK